MEHCGLAVMDGIKDCVDSVTNAYRCLVSGSPPVHQSASDLATNICAVLSRNVTLRDESCLLCALSTTSGCSHMTMTELTCITLTLVDKMFVDLMSQTIRPETAFYLLQIYKVLQEAHVMSSLVHQFQNDDQMIKHLAAKCVSAYISYELHNSGEIHQIWQETCVQAFQNARTCKELDPCIWSFISVLKRLLKDSHKRKAEILQKLLVVFDAPLTILVSNFLPGEGVDEGLSGVCSPNNTRGWGQTFSSLLILLEILCASRWTCSTGVCPQSQRLVYTRARALIKTTASSSCDYHVKRQVLLLMKRTLLQKAGEDLALGEISSAGSRDEHFGADMETLADTVLRAVSADWLQFVPVEAASSFGGSGPGPGQGDGETRKPDHVMLRAVGLVVLKSLELALQTGAAGADHTVGACLGLVFGFLRHRGVPLTESSHLCCWYTLVFAEQDDDMVEAAKTLLALYLRHSNSRCPGSGPQAASGSCSSGFNPHCHFLLFLRSVSFDHSTLLDFLISSETCFLEYLVRYLKHFRADTPGFLLACRKVEESDPYVRAQLSFSVSRGGAGGDAASVPVHVGKLGTSHPDPDRSSLCAQPTASMGLGSGLCLVDYSSSDESGTEDMEVSQGSHKEADEGNMRVTSTDSELDASCSLNIKQEKSVVSATSAEHNVHDRTAQMQTVACNHGQDGHTQYFSLAASQFGQAARLAHTPGSKTLTRFLLCLSDLRRLVAKLHAKNLFPYNPKSLLKLLAQVETVNLSHLAPNS